MSLLQSIYLPGGKPHPKAKKTYRSQAAENHVLLKRTAGQLWQFSGYSTGNSFVQVHDVKDFPANGAIPLWSQAIAGSWNFGSDERDLWQCANGIFICVSSTEPTLTLDSAIATFNVVYL